MSEPKEIASSLVPKGDYCLLTVQESIVNNNLEWSGPYYYKFERQGTGSVVLWFRTPESMHYDDEYLHIGEPFTTDVLHHCARCSMDHNDMHWLPLDHHIDDSDGTKWTHWALCPANGQPIFDASD